MSTSTGPVPAPGLALLPGAPDLSEPSCPNCREEARWVGSPADSGFLAYCPSCDQAFHVAVAPVSADGTIRLG